MPIQFSISIPNAFKTVGEQIDQASHPRSIEMRYLSDYYHISAASVAILAYILRYHPNKVIDGKLRILAQNNNEQFDEVVKKLVRRKFIEPKETSCNSGMCFGITNSAYKAINEGAKFGMDYFEDCITELSSCHIENIYSDKWLQRFYYSMRMEENAMTVKPYEMSIDVAYSLMLSEKFSIAAAIRWLYSDLRYDYSEDSSPASAFAADLACYYNNYINIGQRECQLGLGMNISNVGSKIKYFGDDRSNFLPANLRLGASLMVPINEYNRFTIAADANKLLVPTIIIPF